MAQRVDVETFQALVSAAHLRPLRGGLRAVAEPGGKPAALRRFRADGTIAQPESAAPSSSATSASSSSVGTTALRSGAQFARAWRSAPAHRLDLLQRAAEAGALPRLLRLELSSRMLEELVGCLADHATAAAAAVAEQAASALAAAALEAAAGAAGYAVAVAGLSLQGRQRMAGLAGTLEQGRGCAV